MSTHSRFDILEKIGLKMLGWQIIYMYDRYCYANQISIMDCLYFYGNSILLKFTGKAVMTCTCRTWLMTLFFCYRSAGTGEVVSSELRVRPESPSWRKLRPRRSRLKLLLPSDVAALFLSHQRNKMKKKQQNYDLFLLAIGNRNNNLWEPDCSICPLLWWLDVPNDVASLEL